MSDTQKHPSEIAKRQVSRFRAFLADLFPDEQTLARYREAQAQEDVA